ncbi:hypothetical protein [Robiginitalea marina]|uniref:Uncharacterized protein n=1 Tax=Robiginitalea marina TaxID=2954105 RepID=A0ABT1AVH6_9FLAO|nr:hypothetical protein [Robiginitalea marina]MCO5723630.1 hypothetical protein [Robiginitalea marina]
MKHLYPIKESKQCELRKASPETIRFLLDYSKSLKIVSSRGLTFESNLN